MQGNKLSAEQRKAILDGAQAGEPLRKLALKYGINVSTVSRMVTDAGVDINAHARARANQARIDYNVARRLELSNEVIAKVRATIAKIKVGEARPLESAVKAYGIAIDKRLLEEGRATVIAGSTDGAAARDWLQSELEKIGKRSTPKSG